MASGVTPGRNVTFSACRQDPARQLAELEEALNIGPSGDGDDIYNVLIVNQAGDVYNAGTGDPVILTPGAYNFLAPIVNTAGDISLSIQFPLFLDSGVLGVDYEAPLYNNAGKFGVAVDGVTIDIIAGQLSVIGGTSVTASLPILVTAGNITLERSDGLTLDGSNKLKVNPDTGSYLDFDSSSPKKLKIAWDDIGGYTSGARQTLIHQTGQPLPEWADYPDEAALDEIDLYSIKIDGAHELAVYGGVVTLTLKLKHYKLYLADYQYDEEADTQIQVLHTGASCYNP